MKCPKCGQTNCHYVSNSYSSSKGFSAGKGCCGYILLGPVGLLCGACGAGKKNFSVDEYWICNDCGTKFSAGAVSEAEAPAKVKFYFENMAAYPELESSERIQTFTKEYKESIVDSALMTAIIVRDDSSENFVKQKSSCNKAALEREPILFAVPGDVGLIFTISGIFIGDEFIRFENISFLGCYKNIVYVNQNGLHLQTEEIARELYGLLSCLIPNISDKKIYDTYTDILTVLEKYADRRNSSLAHYSSQQEYENYILNAYDRMLRDFEKADPARYKNHMRIEEEKKELEKKIMYISFALSGIIALFRWYTNGFFSGVFWGIVCVVVSILLQTWYFETEHWKEHDQRFLPDDIYNLKKEKERKPIARLGNAMVLDMSNEKFASIYLEEMPSGSKVEVVNIVRKVFKLGLAEAKARVDLVPTFLSESMELQRAKDFARELEAVGCIVKVEEIVSGK